MNKFITRSPASSFTYWQMYSVTNWLTLSLSLCTRLKSLLCFIYSLTRSFTTWWLLSHLFIRVKSTRHSLTTKSLRPCDLVQLATRCILAVLAIPHFQIFHIRFAIMVTIYVRSGSVFRFHSIHKYSAVSQNIHGPQFTSPWYWNGHVHLVTLLCRTIGSPATSVTNTLQITTQPPFTYV